MDSDSWVWSEGGISVFLKAPSHPKCNVSMCVYFYIYLIAKVENSTKYKGESLEDKSLRETSDRTDEFGLEKKLP